MYLQNHPAFQMFRFKPLMNPDHRQLDNISRTSLYRRIDRISFGIATYNCIMRINIRQETFPLEQGFNITFFFGYTNALFHIFFNPGISLEITINQFLGFRSWNTEPCGQTKD